MVLLTENNKHKTQIRDRQIKEELLKYLDAQQEGKIDKEKTNAQKQQENALLL